MKTNVIIIGEDYDICYVMADFLEMKNFSVNGIGKNGKEAIQLFQKYNPDIVIMDVMMPDYDGLYGLNEIRKINSDTKIIILTKGEKDYSKNELEKLRPTAVIDDQVKLSGIYESINQISEVHASRMFGEKIQGFLQKLNFLSI